MILITRDGEDTLIVKVDNGKSRFYSLRELTYAEWLRLDKWLTALILNPAWSYHTYLSGSGLAQRQVEEWWFLAAVEARPVDLGRVA